MAFLQQVRRLRSRVWTGWPERAYQRERYRLRLSAVRSHLAECLDLAPAGPLRLISMCAGDGRDVIGTLPEHPRRADVAAALVELDPESVAAGVRHTETAGLQEHVQFLHTDATDYATYATLAPAHIVMVCGVWGHVPAHERILLVRATAALCRPGGLAIWTRGIKNGRQRFHEIESLFIAPTWETRRVTFTPDNTWAVATHRYCGPGIELPASGRIFNFQRSAGC